MTQEHLDQITELSKLAFNLLEIATVIEVDYSTLRSAWLDESSPVRKAYEKGRLLTLVEVRKSEIDLASRGHADAQRRVNDLMLKQKQDDE